MESTPARHKFFTISPLEIDQNVIKEACKDLGLSVRELMVEYAKVDLQRAVGLLEGAVLEAFQHVGDGGIGVNVGQPDSDDVPSKRAKLEQPLKSIAAQHERDRLFKAATLKVRELEARIASMEEEVCAAQAIMRDLGPVDDKIVAALAARKARKKKKGKKKEWSAPQAAAHDSPVISQTESSSEMPTGIKSSCLEG